ncbi:dihydrouridine synthase [Gregarina niphandrodes]|uniref:tRNA-dihydrouridine(16/17) synthase [NAD(P)(+)] n=1 Tax=Gregarina niphandrodes TaxID=110365 RepID=A0A023BAI0_GRENI|nr:dihydrouridine synthase [Gregarina niphandrodes]EZG78308.1 dihydrouridine synthase [Gregarina niphandrodes]|eukprot:XP_011129346.1 dihydrouridine synthase [Gregarina niphandrodes]
MKLTAEEAWTYWNERMKAPRYILAPMVNASDLPYRLLCRRYGVDAAYTPMLHSRLLTEDRNYRPKFHPELICLPPAPTVNEEGHFVLPESWDQEASTTVSLEHRTSSARPVSPYSKENTIAQLCGHDPATVVAAGKLLEDRVAAIDLNCGCPQGIARRGQYGSFLLSQPETIIKVVSAMVNELRCPVTVKIRVADPEPGPEPEDESEDLMNEPMDLINELKHPNNGLKDLTKDANKDLRTRTDNPTKDASPIGEVKDRRNNDISAIVVDESCASRPGKRGLEPSSASGLSSAELVEGEKEVEAVVDETGFSLSQYPKTVDLVKRLEALGVLAIAVHGRTPQNKGHAIRGADWVLIRELVGITRIPIIANGSVCSLTTADACLRFTGAAAVMSGEALLEDPSVFCPQGRKDVDDLMLELIYLNKFVTQYATHAKPFESKSGKQSGGDKTSGKQSGGDKTSGDIKALKSHLFSCLYTGFQQHHDLRDALAKAHTLDEMQKVVVELKHTRQGQYKLGYYRRHRKLTDSTTHRKKARKGSTASDGKQPT